MRPMLVVMVGGTCQRVAWSFTIGMLAGAVVLGCASGEGGHGQTGGAGGGGAGGAGGRVGAAGHGGAAGGGGVAGMGGAGGNGGAGGVPIVNDKLVPIACDTDFVHSFGFPAFDSFATLEVVPSAMTSGQDFTADIAVTIRIPKEVLQREVTGAFPDALPSIELSAGQAEVIVSGATAESPIVLVAADWPKTIVIPQAAAPCLPDACPNIVTDDIEVSLGALEGARFSASPGGQACFDVGGDIEIYRFPDALQTSLRLVIGERERQVECTGGSLNQNGTPDDEFDDWVDANHVAQQLCFPIECPGGGCNACPEIESFVGGPREFAISSSVRPYPRAHLAFRASDPDHPESNLVCTVLASGMAPGDGQFFDPLDPSVGVGRWLSVNLDTLQPGGALPGLGGDESLPPLDFECPPGGIGDVTISLVCTDGDSRCDQQRDIVVRCLHGDWCFSVPIDCSASNDCMTDGFCDNGCPPPCDPSLPDYTPEGCDLVNGMPGSGTCAACPGKDNPLPAGTPCSSNGGTTCDGAGSCL